MSVREAEGVGGRGRNKSPKNTCSMIPLYKVQNLAKWNTVQLFQNPHWDTTIKKTNKQNQGHGHARI